MSPYLYSNFKGAEVISVIRVQVNEGDGKSTILRTVIYYLDASTGSLLATVDQFPDGKEAV